MKCSVYIATSVDGFIAGPDGDIEWLHRPEYAEAPLQGLTYEAFTATVDTIVMGRHTFEKVLGFGFWPFVGKHVVVLSQSLSALPGHLAGKAELRAGTAQEVARRLGEEGKRHLYIDGGVTAQRFLDAGLVDELTITRIPVLLGAGNPLFSGQGRGWHLRLLGADVSANGFVQERYAVLKP